MTRQQTTISMVFPFPRFFNSISMPSSYSLSLHAVAIRVARFLSALYSSDPRDNSVLAILFYNAEGLKDSEASAACLADFSWLRRSLSNVFFALRCAFVGVAISTLLFRYSAISSGRMTHNAMSSGSSVQSNHLSA